MTKKKTSKKKAYKKAGKGKHKDHVVVSNTSYGTRLKGIKIYFEGSKPNKLKDDGSISFGKNILELLQNNYPKFKWIITESTDEIVKSRSVHIVRTSLKSLNKMYSMSFDKGRDIKVDIIQKVFSSKYPGHFTYAHAEKYKSGQIADILKQGILNDLSVEDKDELTKFIPDFIAKESVGSVSILTAATQIKTLKELATEMRLELSNSRSESWWQDYIQKNILIIQQGYIKAIEKINIGIGTIKFPDFSLVTHDGFLDILEIKKPSTHLMKEDSSRGNFYWDTEVSKAIIQVENYIETISKHADAIRSFIKDTHKIDLKIIRPRGIILAGVSTTFTTQKQKDDYRLLSLANKNIIFLTYEELVTRLENYIKVLEDHSIKS